jgi:uncharacterized protein (TIGR03435 family)
LPGGLVDIRNLNMKQLVQVAFHLGQGITDRVVEGMPAWADQVSYDIIAKADAKTPVNTLRVMLQTLLKDRFKMAVHSEEKPMMVWALFLGKGGLKLPPAAAPDAPFACGPGEGAQNMIHLSCTNMTMADFVKSLPTFAPLYFDVPVVDTTGIKGAFDVKLDWYPVGAGGGRGADGQHLPSETADMGATTIFDVVQRLGFKLEKRKELYPVMVIDHLEQRPTEN